MKVVKTILLNIVGVVLGLIGATIAMLIAQWLLLSLIPQIPFVPALLSWPVDYEWYAFVGVLMADVVVGTAICAFFSRLAGTRINYGVIALALINLFRYINGFIQNVTNNGFSITLLVMYLVALGAVVFVGISSISGEE